jgi:octaprenyl-diphosphate synthase
MTLADNIREPVKKEMNEFEPFFREVTKSKVPLLGIITNYILRQKGKQMRPMLVFLSGKLLGNINLSTFYAATFIELLHTATLIHDDVVDNSHQRRGFFSINALWKSKLAVLVGDFYLSQGLLLAIENNEIELLRIISTAVREMSEGEILQLEKARKLNINEDIYYEIIRKKTATLIASCTASGAQSVGASVADIEKMRAFGQNLGMAFQIRDDLFEYNGNNLIGKPLGNDIKEKKMTLPLIYALNKASDNEKKNIYKLFQNKQYSKEKLNYIIEFVKEKGGVSYATIKMEEYKGKALEILTEFKNNQAYSALCLMVEYAVTRNK